MPAKEMESVKRSDESRQRIQDLVQRFEKNLASYKTSDYKEAQLREEFINPFFETFGWDMCNRFGASPAYRDIIHEDSIKMASGTKAPDYCFSLSGRRMFFVETKKPSISIKNDNESAFQLRRYAWSAGLHLSILTNFEEFAVYESRQKPNKNDSSAVERVLFFTFRDYLERIDEIASIFSRDAIVQGSLDRFFESIGGKKGTQEVGIEILREIEGWRERLAKNIALRNPRLNVRELNYVIQATIDRIIFLRMCEDRGIEPYKQLSMKLNGEKAYRELCNIYTLADEKYNSGLFHFDSEKGRKTTPDLLSLSLIIDDKILREIIKDLYYPESPYEFSVLKPEILGNVYEQFLGKVIRLTPSHRAVVEEKPEVKKAGGVFYTPQYIVDYMIEKTLGRLCKNKKPVQLSNIRILDPACGSGSFLLGAYTYLLNFHHDYYAKNNPEKWKDKIYQGTEEQWFLTTREKKRILLNNIYGVDKDSQAVEVTKLSLLLKVLEGERKDILERQQKLFREKALPDLEDNIKCGNSLIGLDYYANGIQTKLFGEEDDYRINAFNWANEFPDIMKSGGFDIVIGNPPYVDIKGMPKDEVDYLFNKYRTSNNRINLFAVFIEKSFSIMNPKSFAFSMIVPTSLMSQSSYRDLRELITENYLIENVVRLPNESFGAAAGNVKVDTAIIVLGNQRRGRHKTEIIGYSGYDRIEEIIPEQASIHKDISQRDWIANEDYIWNFNTSRLDNDIISKCQENSISLENCVDFSLGLTPYDKYKGHTEDQIKNRVFHAPIKKNKTYQKLLSGNDVARYFIAWGGREWISYGPWLGAPRELRFFNGKRILVKQIIDWSSKRIWASLTGEELYNAQNAFNLVTKESWSLEYILGILNSKLMTYYHRKKFLDEYKMRFQKLLIKDCRKFPIHLISTSDPFEQKQKKDLINLVNKTLQLNSRKHDMKLGNEISTINRMIETIDAEIDKIIYRLYGLTKDQISIVENEVKSFHET